MAILPAAFPQARVGAWPRGGDQAGPGGPQEALHNPASAAGAEAREKDRISENQSNFIYSTNTFGL